MEQNEKLSWYDRAVRRVMRLIADFGGIPLLLGVFVVLGALLVWIFSLIGRDTMAWFSSIADPTERGLAHIAAAIVFHALFGKSTVTVDGKAP